MNLSLPLLLLALCAALTIGTPAQARKDNSRKAATSSVKAVKAVKALKAPTAVSASKASKTSKAVSVLRPAAAAKLRGSARQAVVVPSAAVRRVALQPVELARPSFGQALGLHDGNDPLDLKSSVALVVDQDTNEVLFSKNPGAVLPIASITKLMTALVVAESRASLDEVLTIGQEDIDTEKGSRSRLAVGTQLTRGEMMHLALMSSENRAANALGRHHPGGLSAFVDAMNRKAVVLGMRDTHYVEPTGLSSRNQSSAQDLAVLVKVAHQVPLLRELSTSHEAQVAVGQRVMQFRNTNGLINNPQWEIGLQKTGYIAEAGRCLVMQAQLAGRKLIMVFLDSTGKYSRIGDAERIRKWLGATAMPAHGPVARVG